MSQPNKNRILTVKEHLLTSREIKTRFMDVISLHEKAKKKKMLVCVCLSVCLQNGL